MLRYFPGGARCFFDVFPGKIFALLGPNGEGKTSTLNAIEDLIKPHSGSVIIAGFDTRKKPLYARSVIGLQLQVTRFQPELTVNEVLQLYAGVYGIDIRKEKWYAILQNKT